MMGPLVTTGLLAFSAVAVGVITVAALIEAVGEREAELLRERVSRSQKGTSER